MRFLLITSARRELVKVWVCQETSPVGSLLPPVDLASIASVIRGQGCEAVISDLRLAKDPLGAYREVLADYKPDAVVLNLSTTGAEHDYALLRATPEPVKRICFGTHAQSMRAEAFAEGVDFVLLGDPEAAISNLIEGRLNGEACPGVLTVDHPEKEPSYWGDLDTLPFPALDMLDMDSYHSSFIRRGKPFTLLLASRGCPHACNYCLYPFLFGSKHRSRGAANVVDEMEEDYHEHGIRAFYFLDATFNLEKSWVEEFAREIISRGLEVDWSCNMRVTPVSREMLGLMKAAGCDWVFYGVEDQDFLKEIRKNTTKEATVEAFRLTREAGISTVAFLMLFPRENIDEKTYARDMLSVLQSLKADAFQCNISIPFPGTDSWREATTGAAIDRHWSRYDPHGQAPPYQSPIDLVDVRRRIYRGFLLSHPIRTLKVVGRMDLRTLASTGTVFAGQNLLPRFLRPRQETEWATSG